MTSTVVVSVLGVAVGWVAHRVRCGWRKGQYVHDVAGAARADGVEYARRVNAAADLAAEGLPAPAAARVLAARCGLSARQARRYVEQAAAAGRRVVPETGVVFTVKLPASLAARIREQARADQVGISALVASVLAEFVSRDRPAGSGG